MNLVLLTPEDLHQGLYRLSGRRARHVLEVHRAREGDTLKVGLVGGLCGTALVRSLSEETLELEATFDSEPPARSPVDLLVAMPRPKVLRRLLQHAATSGVGRIVLLNSARVERSYFSSPLLHPDALEEELRLGLEQGRDTRLPEFLVRERFRPFVEDELPELWKDDEKLLAHPEGVRLAALEPKSPGRVLVAIGPEGGWVPFEIELFEKAGLRRVSLGARPLRVEAAANALVGAVETWREMSGYFARSSGS